MLWVPVIGFVVFFLIVYLLVEATRKLLQVQLVSGRIVKLEGRAPSDLVGDIADIGSHTRASGTIVVRLEGGRAVVHVSETIDEVTAQRVRNVVGRFPTARLKAARRVRR